MDERHNRAALSALIQDAVHKALIDSVLAIEVDAICDGKEIECWGRASDDLRREWEANVHLIPNRLFAQMDPQALAQNVAYRMLGPVPMVRVRDGHDG